MTSDASDAALATYLGISPRSNEEEVLRLLIQLGAQVVGAEEGSLLVLDDADDALVFAMVVGPPDSQHALVGQRVPIGRGITGLAALTREVQIGAPTYTDVAQSHLRDPGGASAVLAAPMLAGDELVGVITAVTFVKDARFTPEHALLYGRIGAVAGVVVEQSRRLRALESRGADAAAPSGAEGRIVEAVTRIANRDPARLERVAALLDAIDALVPE